MQKNYEAFTVEDFLEDPFFIQWVRVGSPEEGFWTQWMHSGPPNLKAMQDAEAQLRIIFSVGRIQPQGGEAEAVWDAIQSSLQAHKGQWKSPPAIRSGRHRITYLSWAAAAAVVLCVVAAIWLMKQGNGVQKPGEEVVAKTWEIAPGGNRAVLTLADGRKIVLDTTGNGAITKQGNVTVIKLDNGQLAYDKQGSTTEVLYNTVTTPKGGQYQLVLADGSRVWLNAASSLRFPTAFNGEERRVELTGEGYFEVMHDAKKPFHVAVNDMDVQVLGTHFNINSYADEPSVKTTLLEGRVMVRRRDKLVYLNPGQAAVVQQAQDNITVDYDVDAEEVVAWKNGLFVFDHTPLDNIMRQIERWYNVDVVYQGGVPRDKFNGSIGRNTNLSEVLKVLEYSNIRFRVEGKTITVLPQ